MQFPYEEISEVLAQKEQDRNYKYYKSEQLKLMDEENKRLSDIAKDVLQDFHCCTRDWSAWQHGTMSEDDFIVCFDDADIVSDTFNAILKIEANAKKEEIEKVEKLQKALVKMLESIDCMERGFFKTDLDIDYIKNAFNALKETGYKTPQIVFDGEMPF